jgi:hypothetical protein
MKTPNNLMWNKNMILVLKQLLNLFIICLNNLYKTAS